MFLLFLDESGDHNLNPKKVDPSYPVFVLSGCIFREDYYESRFALEFNKLKRGFFGTDEIILHTLEMTRPHKSATKAFMKLVDKDFRIKFYTALNNLIAKSEFTIVSCVIKKVKHLEMYGLSAMDPYLLSFDNLLNRLIFEIPPGQKGQILAERRNDILDNQLELAWLNTKINGTEFAQPSEVKRKVKGLDLIEKQMNVPGLQLADLVASPIGRKVLGKKRRLGHEVDFEVLRNKFRQKDGKVLGYGLSILPKGGGPHSQSPAS